MCLNIAIRTKTYKLIGNDFNLVISSLKKYYRDHHESNVVNHHNSFRIIFFIPTPFPFSRGGEAHPTSGLPNAVAGLAFSG